MHEGSGSKWQQVKSRKSRGSYKDVSKKANKNLGSRFETLNVEEGKDEVIVDVEKKTENDIGEKDSDNMHTQLMNKGDPRENYHEQNMEDILG